MKNHSKLSSKVYDVPLNIDNSIAKLKLSAMKIKIDNLTNEQKKYLNSWE